MIWESEQQQQQSKKKKKKKSLLNNCPYHIVNLHFLVDSPGNERESWKRKILLSHRFFRTHLLASSFVPVWLPLCLSCVPLFPPKPDSELTTPRKPFSVSFPSYLPSHSSACCGCLHIQMASVLWICICWYPFLEEYFILWWVRWQGGDRQGYFLFSGVWK